MNTATELLNRSLDLISHLKGEIHENIDEENLEGDISKFLNENVVQDSKKDISLDQEEVIAQCVEKVLDILREKLER